MSVVRKCLRTVWPKEPVPPVMSRVALLKVDIYISPSVLFYISPNVLIQKDPIVIFSLVLI